MFNKLLSTFSTACCSIRILLDKANTTLAQFCYYVTMGDTLRYSNDYSAIFRLRVMIMLFSSYGD